MKPIIIHCTVPDESTAIVISRGLVEERLVACAQIIPSIRSFYMWQGRLNEDNEFLLELKSSKDLFAKIEGYIKDKHPYDVPEILSIEISEGTKEYLDWMKDNLKE